MTDYQEKLTAFRNQLVHSMLVVDRQCLDYRIECNQEVTEAFLAKSTNYTDSPGGLLEFVKACDAIIPRIEFAPGNPNNGDRLHKWGVGNEGSRVLYLTIKKNMRRERMDWDPICGLLQRGARAFQADEVSIVSDDETTLVLRFWWD